MVAFRHCARMLTVLLAAGGAAGCASAGGAAHGGPSRWIGSFKQPAMAGSAVISAEVTQASAAGFGTVVLTPLEGARGRTRIELSITAPSMRGSQLAWAVFPGSCSAATPPVVAATEFPLIDVTQSGGGIVRTEMAMALDPRGSYHATVYSSSRVSDVSNVLMCASLKLGGQRG